MRLISSGISRPPWREQESVTVEMDSWSLLTCCHEDLIMMGHRWMDGLMDRQSDRQMHSRMHGWVDQCTHTWIEGQTDGQTGGYKGGQVERWMDEWL